MEYAVTQNGIFNMCVCIKSGMQGKTCIQTSSYDFDIWFKFLFLKIHPQTFLTDTFQGGTF